MKNVVYLVAFMLAGIAANAQNGEIAGQVTDKSSTPLERVTVMLVDMKGEPSGYATFTDAEGNYTIKALAAGEYNVVYTLKGYENRVERGIIVKGDRPTWVVRVQLIPSADGKQSSSPPGKPR